MPRNVLRQFTGGISNEIDPQNLRDDQGEEALDINLKGFALEPGDGLEELTDAGHYHYRGEWIRDSEAVSFEESGIGVVKTFDNKRPQFEEIVNDDANVSRNLGPSLPPKSIITGSVVSEGSRGLRPAEGSHLLKLKADKFGIVDTGDKTLTPPYSDAPSLEEHRADTNTTDKKIYYYSGQPYWIDDSTSNWKVVTRQPGSSPGEWTTNLVQSGNLTHHSGGYLFKENYFICWDAQNIDTVQLSTSSMTVNSFDTVDASQGGNAGSDFGFTSGATGQEISSLDICNGVITFAQKIKTTNTTPSAYSGSADERWILPPATDSILLLVRDGQTDGESTGNWDAGSDDIEIWAKTGSNPPEKQGGKATWQTPTVTVKGGIDRQWWRTTNVGLKWAASIVKANTWTKIKVGSSKPQFYFINKSNKVPTQTHIDQITVDYNQNTRLVVSIGKNGLPGSGPESYGYYRVDPIYTLKIPYFDFEIKYTHSSMPTSTGQYWASRYWYSQWVNQGNALALNHKRTFQYHYSQRTGRKNIPNRYYAWSPSMGSDWHTKFTLTGSASVNRNNIANSSRHSTARENVKTNIITGGFESYIIRLCSYTPGGSMTIQTGFARSKLWTKATISRSEQSITFAEADTKTFTVGDYIKVQANGNRTLSWNVSARKSPGIVIQPSNGNMNLLKKEDRDHKKDYFLAKITSISNSANKLYLERTDQTESNNPFVDEECYPVINSIDPFNEEGERPLARTQVYVFKDAADEDVLNGSEREVLQTDLFGHVLIGHRPPLEPNNDTKQTIEVRANSGVEATNSDYKHTIKWKDSTDGMLDVRAVTTTSGSQPRIFYVKGAEGNQKLYSQNGTDSDVAPSSSVFSNAGVYYLTSDYLSVVDNDGVTVYDPYYNIKYSKNKPEQAVGLGLTGIVEDALHLIASSVVFVFVKIKPDAEATPKWRLVKTGSTKPETSILSYDFVKPLHFDGLKVWGIARTDNTSTSTEKYDVHTAVPFFESDLKNTWINHSSSSNNISAWGQVIKTREGEATDQGIPRYLSVEWKFDSGVFNSTGNPTIGLNHESNKMLGDQNEFTWYILDAPATLQSGGVGSQITNPKLEIKFKSKVIRNVAFFKTSETVLPSTGQTGANNRISFTNYQEAGQNFYVLNDKAIPLKGGADATEIGYTLGNADAANNAFDASKVGISAFLVGAPNMFNPYGPNIDFYYRASFLDKWGNESAPSVASAEGIQPLDSADDCIQINFDENFFHFDNTDIETIRVYRYGGDSSEWMFLRDIDMPDLTGFPLTLGSLTGSFARVSSLSKFYNFKTFKDITKLRNFTNSNFDLTATGLGSSVTFTASTTNETITTASPHGLVVGDQVRLSGTDLPAPLVAGAVGTENNLYYVESQTANNKITLSSTKSGNDVFTTSGSSLNPLVINDVGHGLTNNTVIHVTNIDGALPGGLAIDTNYYVINKADDTFEVSTSEGGSAIIWLNNGTGTHSWHKPIVFSDAGTGTHSLRKYVAPSDMDGSWNIIQLSENVSPSVAYTTTLSSEINETATTIALASTTNPSAWPTTGVVKIEEEYVSYTGISGTSLTGCERAQYDSSASRHEAAKAVNVIEWVLEIEHRNQDTTTLETDIDTPYAATSGAITIEVEDAALFQASGRILIGNEIYDYTGRDLTSTPNKLTGCTTNAAGSLPSKHNAGVTVFSYEENFTNQDVESMSIEINSFGYRDKARAPVTSLHYLQNDNYPPVGLTYNEEKKNFFETESSEDYYRYITAVGSMYFGALDANLQFSRYGTPEYWPLDAVVTLDSEIRAIMEHAGEGLVWTTNSLYRVRGTDPKAMIAFRVPDAHGIKEGDEQTVATFGGGVLWLTANDGIAYYQAGKVQYLTRDKHIITNLVKPRALVADGVYWLFQKPGNGTGFRLEITGGDLRLCKTSIEAYYAHYSKALGKAIVVTKDNQVSDSDSTFSVSEIGSTKATNISWRSKKIDAGEPALAKALGSLAVVYEVLDSKSAVTLSDGIRGQSLAASLLGMNPDDLDAGDLAAAGADSEVDMYDVFINYGNAEQYFEIDIGGGNLSETERKKIVMPLDFDTSTIKAGDRIWNEMLADNTIVSSVTTSVVGGVTYPALLLDKEPLRSGSGTIYWGNLPVVDVFLNNDTTAARTFVLPPSDRIEPLSADLYLNDLRRFRTISVKIQGNVRVQTLSIRHYPLQQYQAHTLTHSADVFYKGNIDFRVMLDGKLIYRKELTNPEGEFKEERVYLPASSYGQRIHYMNESMSGTIESVQFNGNMAA
ncbi:MAG: hypothetical protein CL886_00130 [Dehalococcoidia bacterium]|nr:hypothetical protein [Dehalococcoidia bacterium]